MVQKNEAAQEEPNGSLGFYSNPNTAYNQKTVRAPIFQHR
jgi:hypothetical protein